MHKDIVKYCVIGAMLVAAVAFLINLQSGLTLDSFIAIAFGAAVYFAVYAKLTTDASTAASAAAALALVAGFFVVVAVVVNSLPWLILNLIAAGCLGYASIQLRVMGKKNTTPPGASTPPS